MTTDCQILAPPPSEMILEERLRQARILDSFDAAAGLGLSQRVFAQTNHVSRATLQGWLDRRDDLDAHPAVVAFCESEAGLRFIHHIVVAAQTVITLSAAGGIRQVCSFLELSGLSRFVASSYGAQQEAIMALEHEAGCFDEVERARLGQQMPPRQITVAQDETFHPQPCLVAIEPVSDFILLERYADNREAKTWTAAITEETGGLNVTIIQSTADECGALAKHAEQDLGAHHSPDLFHVQHEVVKGTSLPLAARVRAAEKRLRGVAGHRARLAEIGQDYPSAMTERHLKEAQTAEQSAEAQVTEAEADAKQMLDEVRGLSADYHPFDLVTGEARSAETVSTKLEQRFVALQDLARRVSLSARSQERIEKAHRVVAKMVATIAFVHATINARVEALGLAEPVERALLERWIPGLYVGLVARKAQRAEDRRVLLNWAEAILPSVAEREKWLRKLRPEDRALVETVAEECAQLFQRSSASVEGRNGHLDLFHHGHHRLPARKLKALTVMHNYLKRRPDGTTAAERFFGQKPRDLFEYLVERLPMPRRPRFAATAKAESVLN